MKFKNLISRNSEIAIRVFLGFYVKMTTLNIESLLVVNKYPIHL